MTSFLRRMDLAGIIILIVLVFLVLMPVVTVFLWAFAEQWFYPALLPTRWGIKYWQIMLARPDVWSSFSTSLQIASIVTGLSALICLPAAYAFARLPIPFKQALFMSILLANAFPRFALMISIAIMLLKMNLVGTWPGVILVQLMNTVLVMVWLPTAAFRAVSVAMEEAARDLGASPLQVFWHITLPQAFPTIAAAMLMTFVWTFYETEGAWLVGAPRVQTVPILMMQMIRNALVVQHGAVLTVLLWVPSLFALLLARRVLGSESFARGLGG